MGTDPSGYLYNALGQLIQYTFGSGTLLVMAYDEPGHLLGEYGGNGTLVRETVWMGDIPVADLVSNGSGGINIYYVHTDQLNAPRKITQPSSNAIVWRWDADPFGTTTPNQNPGGLGTFIYNLRFPGQYYLYQSGLNYNCFRDYDPAMGRYIESDPIGLMGGINPYVYTGSNPISRKDPSGLIVQFDLNSPSAGALMAAYAQIGTTWAGRMLENVLENSPFTWTITNTPLPSTSAWALNGVISVDPDFHPPIFTDSSSCAVQKASTTLILEHELGHAATGITDEMQNIIQNENPFETEMGLPHRLTYGLPLPYIQ